MSKFLAAIIVMCFCTPLFSQKEDQIAQFLKKYTKSYQDIVVQNKTLLRGTNICPPRYEILQQVLRKYKSKDFSVLDIGACQGYFDFKIANEYEGAHCVMIEANENSKAMLHELCEMNSHLPNMTLLTKKVSIEDLSYLEREQHFDVVLALLVIHMIPSKTGYADLIKTILNLGNDVIIEVPLSGYRSEEAERAIRKHRPIYLGTVKRSYSEKSGYGKIYWFKRSAIASSLHLNPSIYEAFKGTYSSIR